MTSIFQGQPPKARPFPIKTRVIWVPGYITIHQIFGPKKEPKVRSLSRLLNISGTQEGSGKEQEGEGAHGSCSFLVNFRLQLTKEVGHIWSGRYMP